jgi:lysophospholipase L1-like esterase
MGDSITDCGRSKDAEVPANEELGGGYAMMIASKYLCEEADFDLKFFNRGISGNRVVDLYARWKIDCLNMMPDVLSILIGVNDTWHEFGSQNGVEVPRYDKFYRMLLDWTLEELPGVKLVICEPFVLQVGAVEKSWLPEINQRREVVRKIAKDYKTIFVPFQEAFDKAAKKAPAEYWLRDGVHPTLAGHMLMSKEWIKAVKAGAGA